MVSFTLSAVSGGGAVPFSVAQVFKRGDVPAGTTLAVSGAAAQVVSKNTWPDGSLKLALISGTAALGAGVGSTVTVFAGAASTGTVLGTGDLQAALTQPVSIGCGGYGTATWSGADWASPFVSWVSGHRMSSWVYRKPVGADAHLVAWLEVRLYAGGAVEILPWVENGYLTVAGPGQRSATYTFTMGGTQRFSAAIDLLNHQRTPLLSGAALSHWLGADPEVSWRHDVAYMQATDMVPRYFAAVPGSAPSLAALVSSYAPLQRGNWPGVMGNAGSDPSIGLLPDWDVHYLTGTTAGPWKALQLNAYSAGRYGIYFRDQATNRPANPQNHLTLCLPWNNTSGITACGSSSTNNYCPDATGTQPPYYQNTHTPSMGYMAYLVTGRFYHLETVQFHASINWLKQSDSNRGPNGILKSNAGACTVRGAAWSLRTLFHAAAITPSGDALYGAYVASAGANIDYYHARYVGQTNNAFGFVTPYGDYTQNGDGILFESTWQQDFFTGVMGYAVLLNLPISAGQQARLAEFFQWKARSVVGRLGAGAGNEFLYRDAVPYTIAMAPSDTPNFNNGSGPWYADWGAIYAATYNAGTDNGVPGPKVAGDLRGGHLPDAESYWGNFMPAIAYAVRLGAPGAAAGFARVSAQPAWQGLLNDMNLHPVWSVKNS